MRGSNWTRLLSPYLVVLAATHVGPASVHAQNETHPRGAQVAKLGGSPNVELLSNLPLDGYFYQGGIDIEQELSRPFVYIPTWRDKSGFVVIDVEDPRQPKVIYRWRMENADRYKVGRGDTGKYFKTGDRYYYVRAIEANVAPDIDSDLCAIVFDVTGLPQPSAVKEIARLRSSDVTSGCVHVFPYKHSDGRALLFASPVTAAVGIQPHTKVYDLDELVNGNVGGAYVGEIPLPELPLKEVTSAYHDVYVAYDSVAKQDKLYGAGTGGFHIFDVTRPEDPHHIGSITQFSGLQRGHSVVATPDGQLALTQMEYQHSPMMIWDLRPLLEGTTQTIGSPRTGRLGSWIADWRNVAHNMEVRWPYVFVASYEDGMQVFSMNDPTEPTTLGWYYTCQCAHEVGFSGDDQIRGTSVWNGAIELDVRNADGLIVVSDVNTGFWTFRLDGFTGWNGAEYGIPNISSVQDWDNGPLGT